MFHLVAGCSKWRPFRKHTEDLGTGVTKKTPVPIPVQFFFCLCLRWGVAFRSDGGTQKCTETETQPAKQREKRGLCLSDCFLSFVFSSFSFVEDSLHQRTNSSMRKFSQQLKNSARANQNFHNILEILHVLEHVQNNIFFPRKVFAPTEVFQIFFSTFLNTCTNAFAENNFVSPFETFQIFLFCRAQKLFFPTGEKKRGTYPSFCCYYS